MLQRDTIPICQGYLLYKHFWRDSTGQKITPSTFKMHRKGRNPGKIVSQHLSLISILSCFLVSFLLNTHTITVINLTKRGWNQINCWGFPTGSSSIKEHKVTVLPTWPLRWLISLGVHGSIQIIESIVFRESAYLTQFRLL